MTPTVAIAWIIAGCFLVTLVLDEAIAWLHSRRVSAAIYLQHYNDLVDKEME